MCVNQGRGTAIKNFTTKKCNEKGKNLKLTEDLETGTKGVLNPTNLQQIEFVVID